MAAAIVVGAVYGARGWSGFPIECLIAFAAALAVGRIAEDTGLVATLTAFYLIPALISVLHGEYYWNFNPIWYAWGLGFLAGRRGAAGWHFPARWRQPLVFWALVLAVGWPLVVAREVDFRFHLLAADLPPNSSAGGPPWFISGWVVGAALNWGLCLLWFDAFFQKFETAGIGAFRRLVLVPLGIGAACACLVALYQGLFDIAWLSGGQWPTIGRAPGTFMDADAFGAFAGWWSIAFPAFALATSATPAFRIFGAVAYLAAWGGVWTSGSRMALLGGLVGVAFAVQEIARHLWRHRSRRAVGLVVLAAVVSVGVLAAAATRVTWRTESPVARARASFQTANTASISAFAKTMFWNRGAPYGTASVQMVEESPVSGVGVGMFHTLFPDYARMLGTYATPDNAQSWYRHQLAELGVVGSLGWIMWDVSFGVLLFRGRARAGAEAEARVVRGALLAIGVISAVSMPTQHFANAFTVVVFAFWYYRLVGHDHLHVEFAPAARAAGRVVVVGLLAAYIVAAGYLAWTYYRPPFRALRADWGYAYGFYDPETIDGRLAQWAERNAVAVVQAPTQWVELTVWVNFADIQAKPADVRVWKDGELVVRTRLRTNEPVVTYLHVPDGDRRVMLETNTNRVVRPRDFGAPDDRELGLAVQWKFVQTPPDGAVIERQIK